MTNNKVECHNSTKYDYVIVGAGPSGLALAYILSERGKKIAVIEAGEFRNRCTCYAEISMGKCLNCRVCSTISGFGGCVAPGNAAKLSFPPSGKRLSEKLTPRVYEQLSRQVWDFYCKFSGVEKEYPELNRVSNLSDYISNCDGFRLNPYPIHIAGEKEHDAFLNSIYNYLSKSVSLYLNSRISLVNDINLTLKTICLKNKIINYDKLIIATGRAGYTDTKYFFERLKVIEKKENVNFGVRVSVPYKYLEKISEEYPDLKIKYENEDYGFETFCFSSNANGGRVRFLKYENFLNIDGHICIESNGDIVNNTLNGNLAFLLKTKKREISYDEVMKRNSITGKDKYSAYSESLNDFLENKGKISEFFFANERNELSNFISCVFAIISKTSETDINQLYRDAKVYGPEIENIWAELKLRDDFAVCDDVYAIGDCTGLAQGIISSFVMGFYLGKVID